jgi:hypothetical protein
MVVNPKSKVCKINNHGERGVAGSQTLLYRSFRDAAKIIFTHLGKCPCVVMGNTNFNSDTKNTYSA